MKCGPVFTTFFLLLLLACDPAAEDQLLEKEPNTNTTGGAGLCSNNALTADVYEGDDSTTDANILALATAQSHNIHNCADADFARVTIGAAGWYSAKAQNVSGNLQPQVTLCIADGQCPSSSPAMAANVTTMVTYYFSAQDYYLRGKSAGLSTGTYDFFVKDHPVPGDMTQVNLQDNETYNNYVADNTDNPGNDANHASAPTLSPGNLYVENGANGTLTATTDTRDFYRVTGLAQNSYYSIVFYTTVTAADLHFILIDSAANSYKQVMPRSVRQGQAFLYFQAESNDDLYVRVGYDDDSNAANVAVTAYRIGIIANP